MGGRTTESGRLVFTRSRTLGEAAHLLISIAGQAKQANGGIKYEGPTQAQNNP